MAHGHNATVGRQPTDPNLEEIRQFCRGFQAGWSKHERLRRSGKLDCDAEFLYRPATDDHRDHAVTLFSFGVAAGRVHVT